MKRTPEEMCWHLIEKGELQEAGDQAFVNYQAGYFDKDLLVLILCNALLKDLAPHMLMKRWLIEALRTGYEKAAQLEDAPLYPNDRYMGSI